MWWMAMSGCKPINGQISDQQCVSIHPPLSLLQVSSHLDLNALTPLTWLRWQVWHRPPSCNNRHSFYTSWMRALYQTLVQAGIWLENLMSSWAGPSSVFTLVTAWALESWNIEILIWSSSYSWCRAPNTAKVSWEMTATRSLLTREVTSKHSAWKTTTILQNNYPPIKIN